MTEDDMRNNSQEIDDWNNISFYQKLSENFIKEFRLKVDWGNISFHQNLSEDLIKDFADTVDWNEISRYQKLSEEFISAFKNKRNLFTVLCYQELSQDFIQELEKDLDDLISIEDQQQIFSGFIILGRLNYLERYGRIVTS
jgi:hypothetical protein